MTEIPKPSKTKATSPVLVTKARLGHLELGFLPPTQRSSPSNSDSSHEALGLPTRPVDSPPVKRCHPATVVASGKVRKTPKQNTKIGHLLSWLFSFFPPMFSSFSPFLPVFFHLKPPFARWQLLRQIRALAALRRLRRLPGALRVPVARVAGQGLVDRLGDAVNQVTSVKQNGKKKKKKPGRL